MKTSAQSTGYRLVRRAGQQGTRPSVLSQAGVEKYATGCDSLSLSSDSNLLLETTSSDRSFSTKPPVRFENINIATQNIRTLSCDVKLANSILEAKKLHLDVLALQEVRRHGTGTLEFDSGDIKGWQFVWSGFKRKSEAGVAFILAPHVKLIESHVHYDARILSVRVIIYGLCLTLTCSYAPTDCSSESSKTLFYRELRKANSDMLKFNRFKSINLGDFNATIGMDSKSNGAWDDILGSNNSSIVKTNANGELFLKFCSEKKLKIINSIFRTKRIHRGTWLHQPTGLVKRLDYIVTRKYISQFITSCRAYRKTSSLFDTDHYMVKMTLRYPTTHKKLFRPISNIRHKPKPNVSLLHQNNETAKLYSEHLDTKLDPDNIPTDMDKLCQHICSSIHESLDAACPKFVQSKSSSPWENAELHELMAKLRKDPNNRALQREIREKRKSLKDLYYNRKALEINCAAEARQVEKEFQLAKTYSMHKSSSKIDI